MNYQNEPWMVFEVNRDKESPSFNAEKIVLKAVKCVNTSFGKGAFVHFIGNDGNEYACLIVQCAEETEFIKES